MRMILVLSVFILQLGSQTEDVSHTRFMGVNALPLVVPEDQDRLVQGRHFLHLQSLHPLGVNLDDATCQDQQGHHQPDGDVVPVEGEGHRKELIDVEEREELCHAPFKDRGDVHSDLISPLRTIQHNRGHLAGNSSFPVHLVRPNPRDVSLNLHTLVIIVVVLGIRSEGILGAAVHVTKQLPLDHAEIPRCDGYGNNVFKVLTVSVLILDAAVYLDMGRSFERARAHVEYSKRGMVSPEPYKKQEGCNPRQEEGSCEGIPGHMLVFLSFARRVRPVVLII
mmetsp:Transcript_6045/g.21338  ORF Transcript_6045/g.21338 Transcript_6045/m.21338 type:complete len:280 (+) Transcript_6045:3036-3875(+)